MMLNCAYLCFILLFCSLVNKMENTCFLCSDIIKNEKLNLKNKKTNYTNVNLLEFLQNIAPNVSLIEHCDKHICHLCFTLINDLDLARRQCVDLTKLLLSYLDNRYVNKIKTESTENFTQLDLPCDSKHVKDEIDIDENEISYVENLSVKIDLVNSDNEGSYIQNDAKDDMQISNDDVQISNECHFCQNKFNSLNALALHIRKQHQDDTLDQSLSSKNNSVNDICTDYGNKTMANIEKKKSVKKKENNNCAKPYKCEQCSKTFKTAFELKSHIQTHSDLRPYVCEICGQAYKHKSALDIHVGMHNGINPFTCNYCNKSFTQKISLDRHMPIHTGDYPYQCDLCGKRFIHHNSFKMHQALHSGKKNYKCEVCGIALISASHLTRHTRVHTGEKKYECPTCTKKFAEKYNLMTHMKLHVQGTSPNKHKCEICSLSFQRPNKLKKHMIAKHQNIDFSKTDECDT